MPRGRRTREDCPHPDRDRLSPGPGRRARRIPRGEVPPGSIGAARRESPRPRPAGRAERAVRESGRLPGGPFERARTGCPGGIGASPPGRARAGRGLRLVGVPGPRPASGPGSRVAGHPEPVRTTTAARRTRRPFALPREERGIDARRSVSSPISRRAPGSVSSVTPRCGPLRRIRRAPSAAGYRRKPAPCGRLRGRTSR